MMSVVLSASIFPERETETHELKPILGDGKYNS